MLGGCGGEGAEPLNERRLEGPGFVFSAPATWRIERTERSVAAHPPEGRELISVTVFRLAKPFRPARWPAAVRELDRVAAQLAARLRGELVARETAPLAGLRSRRYTIAYRAGDEELRQRLAFALRGRREYQLLCRLSGSPSAAAAAACERLVSSFRSLPGK